MTATDVDLMGYGASLLALGEEGLLNYCTTLDKDALQVVEAAINALEDATAQERIDYMVAAGISPVAAEVFAKLDYFPTPKQTQLHVIPPWSKGGPFDVLYGGQAGGGKSLGLLMQAVADGTEYPHLQVWLVRASYPELRDSFLKKLEERNYCKAIGAVWRASEYSLRLQSGSILMFRHAMTAAHAAELLSAECQELVVDERTTMAPEVIDQLVSRIRSGSPMLPVVGVRSGSNPGNVGHARVKRDFIDPNPIGDQPIPVVMPSGRHYDRLFIRSRIADNPHLDDGYYDRLSMLPPDIVAAYRDGDWSKFIGMSFDEWSQDIHVVSPEDFPLDPGAERGVGIDYGLSAPFAALWGAKYPDNLILIYRELYAAGLTPKEQASQILGVEAEGERRLMMGTWLDPSCWARQPHSAEKASGTDPPPASIAADYNAGGVRVFKANNDRIGGKRLLHDRLRVRPDGRPRILVYSTCVEFIRTVPSLPRSKTNPEDVDTKAEDHLYDACRYLLAGLLGLPTPTEVTPPPSEPLPKVTVGRASTDTRLGLGGGGGGNGMRFRP